MREIVPTISLTQKHQTVGPHLCGEQSSPGLCPGQTADPISMGFAQAMPYPISLGGCTPQAMPNPLQPIQKTSILRLRPLRLIFFKSALLHLLQHRKKSRLPWPGLFIFAAAAKASANAAFGVSEASSRLWVPTAFQVPRSSNTDSSIDKDKNALREQGKSATQAVR